MDNSILPFAWSESGKSCFCGVFNDIGLERPHNIACRMTDKLERIWKEAVMVLSRHYPGICLEGLRKTTKNLNQDHLCPMKMINR
jgi:hypothetical protein